jgi:hypothetical protein
MAIGSIHVKRSVPVKAAVNRYNHMTSLKFCVRVLDLTRARLLQRRLGSSR